MRPSDLPTHDHALIARASIAEKPTIPPDRVPWISRMRKARSLADPKATLSYVVARDDKDGSTIFGAPELSPAIREEFSAGTVLQDRYRLIKELGRGGMGVVYLGRDQRLDRSVAVKVILAQGSASSASATMDSRVKTSFAEEARLGAALTHPAIATVFDFGFQHDSPFTVFEYIEGETLRELIERRGRLPLDEVRLVIGPVAQALDFAHERRIVHRDLKPENIRATEQRLFKILDLGLAREFSRQSDWRFAGTPAYAAPEQAAERPSDGRTDQYALAVIIFELLTGRRPFVSDSWLDLLEMHYSAAPPRARSLDPDIPDTVNDALLKALEKDPNRRFSTCTELAVALGCQFLAGPAPLPRVLLETEIKKMGGRWKSVFYPFALKRPRTHLTLAPNALWAIHRTELMRWPLAALDDFRPRGFRGLSFRIRGVTGKDRQWFRFKSRNECGQWRQSLEQLVPGKRRDEGPGHDALTPADTVADPRVEPVVLLKNRPGTRFQLLGAVEAKGTNKRRANNGLAIRGAMMGADAVVDLNAERVPGFARTEHRVSGTAVRAVDDEGRLELKSRWFDNQFKSIRAPMLIMAFLFGGATDYVRATINPQVVTAGGDAALLNQLGGWVRPIFWIVMTSLTLTMFIARWPQLVRPVSTCFLAKAAQSGITVLGNLVNVASLAWSLAREKSLSFDDEVLSPAIASTIMLSSTAVGTLWALSFVFFFLYLGRRAWRINQEFRTMATGSIHFAATPWRRRFIGGLAWCLVVVSSVCLIGWQTTKVALTVAGGVFGPLGGRDAANDRTDMLAETMNAGAWRSATDPNPENHSRPKAMAAVIQAEQAVARRPENATYVRTLGVARYRAGDLSGSIRDLDRSVKIGGFNASAGFFQAAAHAQAGDTDRASAAFEEAEAWMQGHDPESSELGRFREEAAALLYVKSHKKVRGALQHSGSAAPNSGAGTMKPMTSATAETGSLNKHR
jgi:serine/threonine protein kinase